MNAGTPTSTLLFDPERFWRMLLIAVVLHMAGLAIWELVARFNAVEEVPVRVMKIRLGGGKIYSTPKASAATEDQQEMEDVQQSATMAPSTVTAVPKEKPIDISHDATLEAVVSNPSAASDVSIPKPDVKPELNTESEQKNPPAMPKKEIKANSKQHEKKPQFRKIRDANGQLRYVRPGYGRTQEGSSLGNSEDAAAEAMTRYTQVISSWVKKHMQYPKLAAKRGIHGQAMVRIRLQRNGELVWAKMERETGEALLDHEAINVMKRASPMPPAPPDVQGGEMEFLIPVKFGKE